MKYFLGIILGLLITNSLQAVEYYGVNLAGADFGTDQDGSGLPGTYNTQYTYPRQNEVDYLQGKISTSSDFLSAGKGFSAR